MKIILMTFGMFLLAGMINAQDTSSVETYKIAFLAKMPREDLKK